MDERVIVLNYQGSKSNNVCTEDGTSYSLNAMHGHDVHVVCYAIDQQGGKSNCGYAKDVMMTLCSDSHGTPHALCYEVQMDDRVIGCDLYNQVLTGDIACALTAAMDASNRTGPKVLVCKQEKSDGTEVQMDERVIVFKERAGCAGGGQRDFDR